MTIMAGRIDPGWNGAKDRSEALRRANKASAAARSRFSRLKKDMRAGSTMEGKAIAADVLENAAEEYAAMNIKDLLGAIPKWGPDRVTRECARADVSVMAKVREITPGRRQVLVRILRDLRGSK